MRDKNIEKIMSSKNKIIIKGSENDIKINFNGENMNKFPFRIIYLRLREKVYFNGILGNKYIQNFDKISEVYFVISIKKDSSIKAIAMYVNGEKIDLLELDEVVDFKIYIKNERNNVFIYGGFNAFKNEYITEILTNINENLLDIVLSEVIKREC